MSLVFIDTETTGLDTDLHEVWEIAYAVDDGPIRVGVVAHDPATADLRALEMNGYEQRAYDPALVVEVGFEWKLRRQLEGATLVASNPSFDTAFLRRRWGSEPWHHRKLDIASYALPIVGLKGGKLKGLYDIAEALGVRAPDHSAAGDVWTLRECYFELGRRNDALRRAGQVPR